MLRKLFGRAKQRQENESCIGEDSENSAHLTGSSPKSPSLTELERTGLFLLWEPDDKSSITVDIVAVHGLLDGPYHAWQDGGVIWLRDPEFLPKLIPNARILSYGYNSTVALSQSIAGVDQFAEILLNYLEQERRSDAEKNRPLMFICHSLGGIVVKKVSLCGKPGAAM